MGIAAGNADPAKTRAIEIEVIALQCVGAVCGGEDVEAVVIPVARTIALGDAVAVAVVIVLKS